MARRTTLLLLLCAVGILLSASAASASRAEELWKKVRDEFAPQPEEAPAGMAPLPMDILRTLPDETVDESELKRLLDSVEGAVADVAEAGSKALAELVEAIRAKQGSFSHVAGEGIAVRPPKALVDPVPEPLVGPAIPAVPAAPVLPVTDNDDADEKEGHTCWFQEWFDFDSEDLDLEAVFVIALGILVFSLPLIVAAIAAARYRQRQYAYVAVYPPQSPVWEQAPDVKVPISSV